MGNEPQSHEASPTLLLDVPQLVGRNGAFTTRGEAAGWARVQLAEEEEREECGFCGDSIPADRSGLYCSDNCYGAAGDAEGE